MTTKPRYLLVRATPTTYVFMNLHGYGIGQERYAISRTSFWGMADEHASAGRPVGLHTYTECGGRCSSHSRGAR